MAGIEITSVFSQKLGCKSQGCYMLHLPDALAVHHYEENGGESDKGAWRGGGGGRDHNGIVMEPHLCFHGLFEQATTPSTPNDKSRGYDGQKQSGGQYRRHRGKRNAALDTTLSHSPSPLPSPPPPPTTTTTPPPPTTTTTPPPPTTTTTTPTPPSPTPPFPQLF
eukprot:767393-Hanusia_phi.AAC.3